MAKVLKEAKKARKGKSVIDLREVLDAPAPDVSTKIDSYLKLTKAMGISTDVAMANRLYARLSKDVETIPEYISFLKDEWPILRKFVPNHGTKSQGLVIGYTLSSIITYYSTILSLYNAYRTSKTEYLGRVGKLDLWEVKKGVEAEKPEKTVDELKASNKKAAGYILKMREEIRELQAERDKYKEAYTKARGFAVLSKKYILADVSADEFLDYLEGEVEGDSVNNVPEHLESYFR